MTKTFDAICKGILKEMVTAPTQGQPAQPGTPAATPVPGQQPAQPNQSGQPQQPDPELAKAFETLTKHAANNQDHIKAITALQQLLTAQQQNAANQQK